MTLSEEVARLCPCRYFSIQIPAEDGFPTLYCETPSVFQTLLKINKVKEGREEETKKIIRPLITGTVIIPEPTAPATDFKVEQGRDGSCQ
jgi:hypothetical protein